jgi:hypothetical protein
MSMHSNNTPIWRDAQRLLVIVEEAVRRFPRYHKYTLGSDLRRQAMLLCRRVNRAWRDSSGRLRHVEHLIMAVDEFKMMLQLGKEVRAFSGFSQFQQLAELAVALGKQSGGWRRRLAARQWRPLQRCVQAGTIPDQEGRAMLWLTGRILAQAPAQDAIYKEAMERRERVPPHKRLSQCPPTQGLAIGNLPSQLFANVYLNELDQFIKHQLRCRGYVRYVDDFVLVHTDPTQLADWRERITTFLSLKRATSPADSSAGYCAWPGGHDNLICPGGTTYKEI